MLISLNWLRIGIEIKVKVINQNYETFDQTEITGRVS